MGICFGHSLHRLPPVGSLPEPSTVSTRFVTLLLAVVFPAVSGPSDALTGSDSGGTSTHGPVASDTIVKRDLDRPGASVRLGLTALPGEPHVRLGMRRIRVSAEGLGELRTVPFGSGTVFGASRSSLAVEPLSDFIFRERVASAGLSGTALFLPPEPQEWHLCPFRREAAS